jgi:ATP-binding cassette subfamily C (CFTR/MRP) protein 1
MCNSLDNLVTSAPFQIAVALYLLWKTLGPSVLAGFFVMILLIPLNGVIAAKSRKLQQKQMKEKDQRVKMMNEILQGIKVSFFHFNTAVIPLRKSAR